MPVLPRRRLDDGLTGLQRTVTLGGFDDRKRKPVLHRSAGVRGFKLDEHLDALGRDVVDTNDRRVADGVEYRGLDRHGRCVLQKL